MSQKLNKIKQAISEKFKRKPDFINYMKAGVPDFSEIEFASLIKGDKTNLKKYTKVVFDLCGVMLTGTRVKKEKPKAEVVKKEVKVDQAQKKKEIKIDPHKEAEIRNDVCKIIIPLRKADGISFSMDEINKDWGATITSGKNYFEFILTEAQKELLRTGKKIEVCITIKGSSNEK